MQLRPLVIRLCFTIRQLDKSDLYKSVILQRPSVLNYFVCTFSYIGLYNAYHVIAMPMIGKFIDGFVHLGLIITPLLSLNVDMRIYDTVVTSRIGIVRFRYRNCCRAQFRNCVPKIRMLRGQPRSIYLCAPLLNTAAFWCTDDG